MQRTADQDAVFFQADEAWIDTHLDALSARYPDEWIAVRQRAVIGHDPDLGHLLNQVSDLALTCVQFIHAPAPR
jgi:hypothetical protein